MCKVVPIVAGVTPREGPGGGGFCCETGAESFGNIF